MATTDAQAQDKSALAPLVALEATSVEKVEGEGGQGNSIHEAWSQPSLANTRCHMETRKASWLKKLG